MLAGIGKAPQWRAEALWFPTHAPWGQLTAGMLRPNDCSRKCLSPLAGATRDSLQHPPHLLRHLNLDNDRLRFYAVVEMVNDVFDLKALIAV